MPESWKRLAGGRIELVYFPVPDAVLLARLRERNAALPPGTFVITEEMFALFSTWFEPPEEDESAVVATSSTVLPGEFRV